jgi:hypothetical protein
MREITVIWDEPRTIKQVRDELNDKEDDYGLYQIYGYHPTLGADTLRYIGKAEQTPFSEYFRAYNIIEECRSLKSREEEPISIRIGRIHCEEYAGEDYWKWPEKDWKQVLRDTEAHLIDHHYERFQLLNRQRPKWKYALSIENAGHYGSLDKMVRGRR